MQVDIKGLNVYFGNVIWQPMSPGEDWRKVVVDAFEDGHPKRSSVFIGKENSAVGSVQEAATGVPFGALFAAWCNLNQIPFALYVDDNHVVAVIDGIPRIERHFDMQGSDVIGFAKSLQEVSFQSGCLVFGKNSLFQNSPLTPEVICDAVGSKAKSFKFRNSISYIPHIVIVLLAVGSYLGYEYYSYQQELEKQRIAEEQRRIIESQKNPKQEYIDAENQALRDIRPLLCNGDRFYRFAKTAINNISTNINGWQWESTTITCDTVTSEYKRTTGTNESMRRYILNNSNMKADFSADMNRSTVSMMIPGMDTGFIRDDFSATDVAIDETEFFFGYGSQMQYISDNVKIAFSMQKAEPIIALEVPEGVRATKKANLTVTGDAVHWSAISQRFFNKPNFLLSSMKIVPEEVENKKMIKFTMEGMYLVH